MIKAIIIDDEENARYVLRNKLEQNFKETVNIVGEADDVDTGISLINKTSPDLVFLDIKMRKGTGFDLLQKIDKVNFEVIFITAYDNFAVKAFEFSAFGYLLKPIKAGDLKKSLQRLEKHLQRLKDGADKRVRVLIDNYGDEAGKMKRICISNMEGFKVVDVIDIVRLEADRNYTHFILNGGKKITVSKTIGDYEDLLLDHGFYRLHQSHIVNLRHVNAYLKSEGGKVEMSDGEEIYVSRQRKAGFISRFV